jgi:NitT/TauT family transport system permease protein
MRPGLSGYLGAVAALLLLWQMTAWLAGPLIVADPASVFAKLAADAATPMFRRHVFASCVRIAGALLIAFATGVPIGLAIGSSRRADKVAAPLIYLTYPIPKIVFLPLVLLAFGLGDAGKIAMLSLILFFHLLITSRDAARVVAKAAKYSLYSLGGTRWDLFRHVIWPACLPAVFTALRVATGTVVAVLFFVESIGAQYGMGFYIMDAWGRADVPQIFTGITVLALIGALLYEFFDILERIFCKWNRL